jgi:hypothetical protein
MELEVSRAIIISLPTVFPIRIIVIPESPRMIKPNANNLTIKSGIFFETKVLFLLEIKPLPLILRIVSKLANLKALAFKFLKTKKWKKIIKGNAKRNSSSIGLVNSISILPPFLLKNSSSA